VRVDVVLKTNDVFVVDVIDGLWVGFLFHIHFF
jgi:hypothetical protein